MDRAAQRISPYGFKGTLQTCLVTPVMTVGVVVLLPPTVFVFVVVPVVLVVEVPVLVVVVVVVDDVVAVWTAVVI